MFLLYSIEHQPEATACRAEEDTTLLVMGISGSNIKSYEVYHPQK